MNRSFWLVGCDKITILKYPYFFSGKCYCLGSFTGKVCTESTLSRTFDQTFIVCTKKKFVWGKKLWIEKYTKYLFKEKTWDPPHEYLGFNSLQPFYMFQVKHIDIIKETIFFG